MAHTASRTALRTQGRKAYIAAFRPRRQGQRHPLVATAMVLPWQPCSWSSSAAGKQWSHKRRPWE